MIATLAQLPTESQLRMLSVRGAIGYAARCVRRARHHYQSTSPEDGRSLDNAIDAAEAFVVGRVHADYEFDLQQAVQHASDANAESVAVAATHLCWALNLARSPRHVRQSLEAVVMAVDCAYDACYFEDFVEASSRDFFAIYNACGPMRYPEQGAEFNASEDGVLVPVWFEASEVTR